MILYHEAMTVELYKQLADLDEKCCNDNYTNKLSFVKIGNGNLGAGMKSSAYSIHQKLLLEISCPVYLLVQTLYTIPSIW